MDDAIILESVSLRQALCSEKNTEILQKVGNLILLPNHGFAMAEQVAEFYKVPIRTIRTIIARHRDELESDGYKVLTGKEFEQRYGGVSHYKARSIAIFPRRAILRIGMLLVESDVAKLVRHYLLASEEHSLAATNRNDLLHVAKELRIHAEKIALGAQKTSENAAQLIRQADLLTDVIREVYHGRDEMREMREKMAKLELRFSVWENNQESRQTGSSSDAAKYINDRQIEILKQQVRSLPDKPITVWKKFNKFFDISRYRFLPASKFEQAIQWLKRYSD